MDNSKNTKFDIEMQEWNRAFGKKKNLKIAIYGTGRMTYTLIARLQGYNIVGLCDRDESLLGEKICGVQIVDREYVEKNADILVINTSESYWETIYKRIRDWKVPIYYRNGMLAESKKQKIDAYWNKRIKQLNELIGDYEVISFDVFDTMLMRKLYCDSDLFRLVESKLTTIYNEQIDFYDTRKRAASSLSNPTFDEIYKEIERISSWSKEIVRCAKRIEWETDKSLVCTREEIADIYNAVRNTKEIYFVTDMYYSAAQICELMNNQGIVANKTQIIVSCECNRSKGQGTLWEYYSNKIVQGRTALHIGDNLNSDIIQAEKYAIKSYKIRSPQELLDQSSIQTVLPYMQSLYSSVCMGNIAQKIFRDPFGLNKYQGRIKFDSNEDFGYCVWGTVIYLFFEWLYKELQKRNIKKVAFFAREGYILMPLFEQFLKRKKEKDIELLYLQISRRAVMIPSISTLEEAKEVARFPYKGSVNDFFAKRFNVSINRTVQVDYLEAEQSGLLDSLIAENINLILSEAKREKDNYLKYLNTLNLGQDYAVVDSQLYGSTQFYLQKLQGTSCIGYYMCACLNEENAYSKKCEMYGCYPGVEGLDGKQSSIYKYAMFTESFLTSENGMFEYVDDNGSFVYAPKQKNQTFFAPRIEMKHGVEKYIAEMIDIQEEYGMIYGEKDYLFADHLLESFAKGGFIPNKELKSSFFYDNAIAGKTEVPLWE